MWIIKTKNEHILFFDGVTFSFFIRVHILSQFIIPDLIDFLESRFNVVSIRQLKSGMIKTVTPPLIQFILFSIFIFSSQFFIVSSQFKFILFYFFLFCKFQRKIITNFQGLMLKRNYLV